MAPIVGLRPTSPQRGGRDADRASAVACCCQPATYLPPELPLSRRSNRPETTPCPTGFALVQIVDCPCIPRMRIGRGCLPTARWRLPFQAPRAQIIALRGASAKSSDPIPSLHPGRVLGVLQRNGMPASGPSVSPALTRRSTFAAASSTSSARAAPHRVQRGIYPLDPVNRCSDRSTAEIRLPRIEVAKSNSTAQ